MYRKKIKRTNASLKALLNRKKKLFDLLNTRKMFCMGNIVEKMEICGTPTCGCRNKKNPKLHGPYLNLAYRGGDKSGMLHLTPQKAKFAKIMVKQYNDIWDIIREIACINLELLRRKEFESLKNS